MEENDSILSFGLFFFSIVIIIIIGSVFLFLNVLDKNKVKEENDSNISNNMKITKDKEYVYYENESLISEELSITKKYPVININTSIAKEKNEEIKKYIDETYKTKEIDNENVCSNKNNDNIKSINFLEFANYNFENYLSLLIYEENYDCNDLVSKASFVRSYTFNTSNGSFLNYNDILKEFNIGEYNLEEEVEKHLEELYENNDTILIDETIDNLKEQETYTLYIDEYGDIRINYVVKTTNNDYNDTIIVNR